MYNNRYNIPGCRNTANEATIQYYPNFEQGYEHFKSFLQALVVDSQSKTFYKFSDGEYLFQKGVSDGSTSKGRRDTNIGADVMDLSLFKEGMLKNDFYMVECYEQAHKEFRECFSNISPIPAEYPYGLIANKSVLNPNFSA